MGGMRTPVRVRHVQCGESRRQRWRQGRYEPQSRPTSGSVRIRPSV